MSEIEYFEKKKKQLKDTFGSKQFLVFLIYPLFWIIISLFWKNKILNNILYLDLFFIFLTILGYFHDYTRLKKDYLLKSGKLKLKWQPYLMPRKVFLEECESGFFYSYIEVNGKIHNIEVQIDKVKKAETKLAFIDDNGFDNLDDFFNFQIDGTTCLNDLEFIPVLECLNQDPHKILQTKEKE